MIRTMVCATHDRTSDAETGRRTRVDLDWKAGLGVEDDSGGIAARTFSLMRTRMIAADADNELFNALLATAVAKGIFKGRLKAIIGSSPVMEAGAVADTYELIRGFWSESAGPAGWARRPRRGWRLHHTGRTGPPEALQRPSQPAHFRPQATPQPLAPPPHPGPNPALQKADFCRLT
jgi:hypothetical protein